LRRIAGVLASLGLDELLLDVVRQRHLVDLAFARRPEQTITRLENAVKQSGIVLDEETWTLLKEVIQDTFKPNQTAPAAVSGDAFAASGGNRTTPTPTPAASTSISTPAQVQLQHPQPLPHGPLDPNTSNIAYYDPRSITSTSREDSNPAASFCPRTTSYGGSHNNTYHTVINCRDDIESKAASSTASGARAVTKSGSEFESAADVDREVPLEHRLMERGSVKKSSRKRKGVEIESDEDDPEPDTIYTLPATSPAPAAAKAATARGHADRSDSWVLTLKGRQVVNEAAFGPNMLTKDEPLNRQTNKNSVLSHVYARAEQQFNVNVTGQLKMPAHNVWSTELMQRVIKDFICTSIANKRSASNNATSHSCTPTDCWKYRDKQVKIHTHTLITHTH